MERLCKLCLKDLYILKNYISANYNDWDKEYVIESLENAIQKVTEIRVMNNQKQGVMGALEDWI